MRPSEALNLHRADIRRVVETNGATNPRVFGSAMHGEDTAESDLDLLVGPHRWPDNAYQPGSHQARG